MNFWLLFLTKARAKVQAMGKSALVYVFQKSQKRKQEKEDKKIPAGRLDYLVVLKHSLVVIVR